VSYTPKTWTTGETITAAELNAIEQGVQGAASTADTANTGLTSKVNSSTYTAGLAGKADLVSGSVPDTQLPARLQDTALRAAFVPQPTTGTASATTYLRGDGSWSTPAGGGSGSGLPSTVVNKTTAYTAAAGDFVQADTTTAGFTVTLPSAPAVGALVAVKKVDATANTLTIVPSGTGNIDGDPNATTTTKMAGAVFEHVGADVWRITASMTTTGPAGPTGPQGPTGATGATGPAGTNGQGVPVGGTTGQVLTKTSATDYATGWAAPSSGGGGPFPNVTTAGSYFTPVPYIADGAGYNSFTLGQIEFTPLFVPVQLTASAIYVKVSVGGAGSFWRVGIYNDNAGTPGTLRADAGQIDASTAAIAGVTGLSQALSPGLYWLAGVMQGATGASLWRGGQPQCVPDSRSNGQYLLNPGGVGPSSLNSSATTYTGALPATVAIAPFTNNGAVGYALLRSA
jgi:hypothetical protein